MANNDLEKVKHVGIHLAQHALKGEHGKQVVGAVVGTGMALGQTVATAIAAAPLLPLLALGGAVAGVIWWWNSGE